MKKFKTTTEQKEYLIKNKKLKDEEIIIDILKERPYASIINPYKKFFYTSIIDDVHCYETATSIIDYYKLANFDDLVAKELHYKIGVFERRIKGAFAYVLSSIMKTLGDETATMYIKVFDDIDNSIEEFKLLGFNDYNYTYNRSEKELKVENENTKQYRKTLLKNIADLNDGKKKQNNLFKKYINGNIPIPFWLVVHTMSIGELLSLYQMLSKETRNDILDYLNTSLKKQIYKDTIFKFEDDLNIIKDLRNIVNHYEPLFEFIRSKPKSKILFAINRIVLFSNKTVNYCYKDLKSTIPTFKNNNNSDIVDIYCKITSTIKKRDD